MQIPGRGTGLIANRTIHRGEQLFGTTPAVMIERELLYQLEEQDRVRFMNLAVNQLPETTREMFLQLWGQSGGDHVDDVISTHGFGVNISPDNEEPEYTIVVPEVSVSQYINWYNEHESNFTPEIEP